MKYASELSDNATLTKRKRSGRPENDEQTEAFLKTCQYFEVHDDEQFTITTLLDIMQTFLDSSNTSAYTKTHFKRKLLETFGEELVISNAEGKSDIVTLKTTAKKILRNYYEKPKDVDLQLQKILLIEAAAKLIKSDIKMISTDPLIYPALETMETEAAIKFLPSSLNLLLRNIIVPKNDLKVAAIGQSIVQSSRPRKVIAPLPLGIAVQMHYHYRSRHIIDTLHKLGFCVGYNEVLKFERNASTESEKLIQQQLHENSILHFVADNVDHNSCTLNGENTMHGMGIIACVTKGSFNVGSINRSTVSNEKIKSIANINILYYKEQNFDKISLKYEKITGFDLTKIHSEDILWQYSMKFKDPIPHWGGYMQILHNNDPVNHSGKAQITFLPIIDMNPSDMSCIYSTLNFVSRIAHSLKKPTIITFDQPLFWKASKIIHSSDNTMINDIVLTLGTFHTVMNLLGALGTIMQNSGLDNILGTIYTENSVIHMLRGKAVSRALRGHFLVDLCLSFLLAEKITDINDDDRSKLENIYSRLLINENITEDEQMNFNETLDCLEYKYTKGLKAVSGSSRTSSLWINYQLVVNLIQNIIRADRLGNWNLHLQSIKNALPVFAAAGHYNYTKSAYLYLQSMNSLSETNPEVFHIFSSGNFVIRRSEKQWAGLSPDLVIEQVLMRALKSSGGLTRGTGFNEVQRSVWLLSMPICSAYNLKMQELTEVLYETSEQHKSTKNSRINRDREDANKILGCLQQLNVFDGESSLRNISTGVVADMNVNVDSFYKIGEHIVEKIDGKDVFQCTIKRTDKVNTLASKSSIKLIGCDSTIDSALLFQRLIVLANSSNIQLEDCKEYELCAYPPALFESPSLLLKANKPQLKNTIVDLVNSMSKTNNTTNLKDSSHYTVLDGGSLLHKIPWIKNTSYNEIIMNYVNYVLNNFGKGTVVFDGYPNIPTVKDNTHIRRAGSTVSPQIKFQKDMIFHGKKDVFLRNTSNKQRLINFIAIELEKAGVKIIHSEDDADVDIVKEAIGQSLDYKTIVIGEDTDLLILLLNYFNSDSKGLLFKSNKCYPSISHDITHYYNTLGEDVCSYLLFVHAFSGCDSTSSIYGIGKGIFLKKVMSDERLKEIAFTFLKPNMSQKDVVLAGEAAMCIIYKGNPGDSLDNIRHKQLVKKVTTASSFVKPEKLPPTSSATKYHSLRVYFQIMLWKKENAKMKPDEWGWQEKAGKLFPILTDKESAPISLLKIVRCNCQSDCSSRRCGCRKNNLICTSACGHCQENNCRNVAEYTGEEDEAEEENILNQ